MKIREFEIKNFIPTSQCGLVGVKVDIHKDVILMIGTNGSGKSSVLKQLSPVPPVSTIYNKSGYESITYEHDGHTIKTISDFSKTGGAHEFYVDDENMNTSGTTGTQLELCEKYFGSDKVINLITSTSLDICSMNRGDRKTFMMAAYPSDLSFILERHKYVQRCIKDIKANIKMLKGRETELTSKLLNEDEFLRLSALKSNLQGFINDMDKIMFILNEDKQDVIHMAKDITPTISSEELKAIAIDSRIALNTLVSMRPDLMNKKGLSSGPVLQEKLSNLKQRMETIMEESHKLKEEICEIENVQMGDIDLASEESKLVKQKVELENILNTTKTQSKYPILRPGNYEPVLDTIRGAVQELVSNPYGCVSAGELESYKTRLTEIDIELSRISQQQETALERKNIAKLDIEKYKKYDYPKDCDAVCSLKDNFAGLLQNAKLMHEKQSRLLEELAVKKASLESNRHDVQTLYTAHKTNRDNIQIVVDSYLSVGVKLSEVLDDTILNVASKQPNKFTLIFKELMEISKIDKLRSDAVQDIAMIDKRLAIIRDSMEMAKRVMDKSTINTKLRLEELDNLYDEYCGESKLIENELNIINMANDILELANRKKDVFVNESESIVANKKISMIDELIKHFTYQKNICLEKLQDISITIKEQEEIRLLLKKEVMPNLADIDKTYQKWQHLEKALSPSTGIAHKLMVKFMNTIIKIANEYIAEVWSYDMALELLDEDKPLTYNLPMLIQDTGRVSDINLCSTAQTNIVNLTFNLALAKVKKVLHKFPIKIDELDAGLMDNHRESLHALLRNMMDRGEISQLFLISHHSSLFTAFKDSQIVCLNDADLAIPREYNVGVTLE